MHAKRVVGALTIAGSDSGGGAGIQADLKTFAALGVHGTCAITCITAQNPEEVRSVEPVSPAMVRDQIEAVFAELRPHALKTGMLFSTKLVREVAQAVRDRAVPIIVDPVMIATSGAPLLERKAVEALEDELFPEATLITPNLQEAESLLSRKIKSPEELREAARDLQSRYGCAALVKGGHLKTAEAIDFYYDGKEELMLTAPRVMGVSTHGTGCTYSAAITAYGALGKTLPEAVIAAKTFISNAIAFSEKRGRHFVLNSFWAR